MKQHTRIGHIDCVRRKSRMLVDRDGRLRKDWVELAGNGAPTLQILLDEGVLPSPHGARFVGVDLDAGVIKEATALYGEDAPVTWVHGNMVSIIEADIEAFPNAGVLVFDSWNAARGRDIEQILPILFNFARKREQQYGEFFLILNVSLKFVEKGAHRYRSMVEQLFEAHIPEAAWVTYRSSPTSNQMLLTRLRFGF